MPAGSVSINTLGTREEWHVDAEMWSGQPEYTQWPDTREAAFVPSPRGGTVQCMTDCVILM